MTELAATELVVTAHGDTHPGLVRKQNEDAVLIEPDAALFAVFDGVGGHNAGEVASAMARDIVRDALVGNPGDDWAAAVSEALIGASAAIHGDAQRRSERRGMGTTAVVVKVLGTKAVIAHIGDSRVYRARDGALEQVTRDHTIIADLVEQGVVTEREALHHPYRNVLSRNLGSASKAIPEIAELELAEGDRLLLCSDGLSDYASRDGIAQILRGGGGPERKVQSLIDLALRGGGGDNVTAVVVEVGVAATPGLQETVRSVGAATWAAEVPLFAEEARNLGIGNSPVAQVIAPGDEERVAVRLAEAVRCDLEQTTGAHVWDVSEKIARQWLDGGGEYPPLRALFDLLNVAAQRVLGAVGLQDQEQADMLEPAVARALVVGELALGGVLAQRLRQLRDELAARGLQERWTDAFAAERTTLPLEPARSEPPTPEVTAYLVAALALVEEELRATGEPDAGLIIDCVERCHQGCLEQQGVIDGERAARELFGTRLIGEPAIGPLFDAVDRARRLHLSAAERVDSGDFVARSATVSRLVAAHHALVSATARIVVEAARPTTDELRALVAAADDLRKRVARNEEKLARLDRRHDTLRGWSMPEAPQEDSK